MTPTPEAWLASIAALTGIAYFIGFALQFYSLYLNHKQAKVKNDSARMVQLLESISTDVRAIRGRPK